MFRIGFHSAGSSVANLGIRMGALGIAAVLVLGGCSGSNDDPSAEAAESMESPSASPSSTPSPSDAYKPATAEGPAENVPFPVLPELAAQESKEGLEAFAEYWYMLVNYGYETGDSEPLRAITGPSCSVCENYYSSLDSGFEDRDWMAGSAVHVRDVHSDFILTPDRRYQVLIQITQDDLEYYGPGGVDYGPTSGITAPIVQLIEAVHQNGSWRVVRVENI